MHGTRLRDLREERHLTQKELAEKLHISESQIYRYETDEEMNPRADAIIKIAEFFNVSTDYLLGITDERGFYTRSDLNSKEAAAIAA